MSYATSYFKLHKQKDTLKYFYTMGLIYANYMEIWTKYCILNYDGYIEKYSVKKFNIDSHDFLKLYKDPQTKSEFLSLGINEQEYNHLSAKAETIQAILKTNNLSFAFRYPCDKDNNIYLNNINDKQHILDLMSELISYSLKLLTKYHVGVANLLLKQNKAISKALNNGKDTDYSPMILFKERLKELRTGKGLSQAQLAEILHVSQRSISSWETGFRQPDYETLEAISKYFDVTTDYLLGLD